MKHSTLDRRDFVKGAIALATLPSTGYGQGTKMTKKPIPATGESLPVIGLGTWQVFDVSGSEQELDTRRDIVATLVEHGGSVIDSSPMYARSERIIGEVIEAEDNRDALFLATKVWTNGKESGARQMQQSAELMSTEVIDLMQVHNLRDLDVHWGTIRELQQDGRIRYNGITDYRASALDEMEQAIRSVGPQFIQINYSLGEREADRRLLPFAMDQGIAVLINRPFVSGALFRAVRGRSVPDWAQSFAASWGQFFLKYIVSHPAVTCVIPATSKVQHMRDNAGAGSGALPDDTTRKRMEAFVDAL